MTGIGPVEPYHPGEADGPHQDAPADVLKAKPPRLEARWAALPRSYRRTIQALAVIATATGALFALRPAPPDRAAPNPYPWPAGVTTLRYEGRGITPTSFRFEVDVARGTPVTVRQVDAGLPELSATTTPRLPLTVKAGNPRLITVHISVYDCAALPPAIDLPHLDLLISNETAQQQQSFLFGGTYPHDLETGLRALCFPNRPPPTPTSPGQNTRDRLTRR
ncbi:hypothetical protein [Streptomyces sp. NBC_00358]|jgi:hypothetical protein|uniref:hypothetical protein n=1 Tax=Streptomyces sp. NBC_00358 TaxID=2975725 RepID=UPI002E2553B6